MTKQVGGLMATAGLVVGTLIATALTASAGDDVENQGHGFSERSIKGWWGFNSVVGTLLPPAAPQPTPMTSVGRIYFDGVGGCSVKTVVNVNGESAPFQSSSCTYSVDADGFGESEAVFPGAPIADPVPVSFVIVDKGRELRVINTKFIVDSFTARRQ
jgi:hypothetical protein